MHAISKEVNKKFQLAAEDKKASSCLPQWGHVCRFGDEESFHKAPKVNDIFSQLLTKTVSLSRSLSLVLDDSVKLEACIHGQIQSQSFSLWAVAAVFEFLKVSNCVPEDPVFNQLVMSMMDAINAQVRAAFTSASFLKQKCREAIVSLLPASTHGSVKLVLLTTPSSSSLFSDEVIKASLTKVKEDLQIKLLSNLSLHRGGKQSASAAASSGRSRGSSSSSSSSRYLSSSRGGKRGKRTYSSSPVRRSKVSFDTSGLQSPTPRKSSFRK